MKITETQKQVLTWAKEHTKPDGTFMMFQGYPRVSVGWTGTIYALRAMVKAMMAADVIDRVATGVYRIKGAKIAVDMGSRGAMY